MAQKARRIDMSEQAVFGIYGDRFGRRLALSAVIFLMAFSTVAQAGVLAPILLVVFRLL